MKLILSILIGIAMASAAFAEEEAVDAAYFHPAASLYIQGDTASASNLVAQGLSLHPDDGKLKRLKELLEKQEEDQKQQDDQKNQDDQNQEKKQPEEDNQKESEQNQQQEEQQPSEPESTEQMTEDEAKQLLDAMRQEEKNKRLQLHPVLGAPVKVDKDW